MTVTSKFTAHLLLYINILYMKFAMLSQEFKCNTERNSHGQKQQYKTHKKDSLVAFYYNTGKCKYCYI